VTDPRDRSRENVGLIYDAAALHTQGLHNKANFPYTAQTFSELAQPTAQPATAAAPGVRYPDAASATAFAISCNDTKWLAGTRQQPRARSGSDRPSD